MELKAIAEMSADSIVDGLVMKKFSILKSAKSNKLRREMRGPGLACRLVLWYCGVLRAKNYREARRARRKLWRLLEWGAPCEWEADFQPQYCYEKCLVIGFNHPSLGEIVRFIYYHMKHFLDRRSVFPVNLPWYEALAPVSNELDRLGIVITPVITPSSAEKIGKNLDDSEKEYLRQITTALNSRYLKLVCNEAHYGNSVIWVAPSATRQATVFKTHEMLQGKERVLPQTMTLLATALKHEHASAIRANDTDFDYCFIPAAVEPGGGCNRGLNLFKPMRIHFGKKLESAKVEKILATKSTEHRGSIFEHEFLMEIGGLLLADSEDPQDTSMLAPKD